MNCKKVRQLLAAFTLGELDLGLHRKIEGHVTCCKDCANEMRSVERDVLKISSALGSEILPPSGLMIGMAAMLPDRPRRLGLRIPSVRPVLAFAAACVLMFVAFLAWPRHATPVEALALADASVPMSLMTDSDASVARSLSRQTGVDVSPISLSPKDRFEGGTCVKLNGRELPVLLYSLDGKRVAAYQMDADALRTNGMTPMQMGGRKFFCCSHNGGALVAFTSGKRAYVFSAKMDEMSLTRLAMKAVS
jgi:hypothetical protein